MATTDDATAAAPAPAAAAPLLGPFAGAFMREELTASLVLSHAARWHPGQVVVDGDTLKETTWADLARRAFVFGVALRRRLLPPAAAAAAAADTAAAAPAPPSSSEAPPPPPPAPAVVATLAFNSARHLEAWYAVSAAAAGVLHTLNPRLSPADLRHILAHGGAAVVCADPCALPLLRALGPLETHCPLVRHVVFLCDAAGMPAEPEIREALGDAVKWHCHESLIEEELLAGLGDGGGENDGGGGGKAQNAPAAAAAAGTRGDTVKRLLASLQPPYPWPRVSEDAPAGLAYTSGTTGLPKGVLFTHRANLLTALAASLPDGFSLGSRSTVLLAVPMFHANGWQLPHAAPMTGARLVMPRPEQLSDGRALLGLIERTGSDCMACVPTVWQSLVAAARARRAAAAAEAAASGGAVPPPALARPLGPLRTAVVGGAACPRALAEALELELGVAVKALWGMTELGPIGTVTGASERALRAMREDGAARRAAAAAEKEGGDDANVPAPAPAAAAAAAAARPPQPHPLLPPTAVTPTVPEVAAACGAASAAERAGVTEGLLRLATGQGRPHCFIDMRIVRRRRGGGKGGQKRPREEEEGDHEAAAAAADEEDAAAAAAAAAIENGQNGENDDDDDDLLEELPLDGVAFGHLQVRGGTVMRRYHRGGQQAANGPPPRDTAVERVSASPALRLARGLAGFPRSIEREWFDTGDVGSIDARADGAVHLTDRAKDVIKSGGEWISSLALESAASRHARVAAAAAVGVPHERWGERPLLVVVLRPGEEEEGAVGPEKGSEGERGGKKEEGGDGGGQGAEAEAAAIAALKKSILAAVAADARLARWQVPDDVVFVESLPLNATGKVSKLELRRIWRGHYGVKA